MSLALNVDGTSPGLTDKEVERFRLLLSTFQDGSGMLLTMKAKKLNKKLGAGTGHIRRGGQFDPQVMLREAQTTGTLPGWRDLERVVAMSFSGLALESKAIFDVIIPHSEGYIYGISCKMRAQLNAATKINGRVNIEVSNAAGRFMNDLLTSGKGITADNLRLYPQDAGEALFKRVKQFHEVASTETGGIINISRSSYLILQYNNRGSYQLFQYSLTFPDWKTLTWSFPEGGKRLVGCDATGGKTIEWYPNSGGQLKYYPLSTSALWKSTIFELEPIPSTLAQHSIINRAVEYFPDQWRASNNQGILLM